VKPNQGSGSFWRPPMAIAVLLIATLLGWGVYDELRFASERIGVYLSDSEEGLLIDAVEPRLPADLAGIEAGDLVRAVGGEPVPDFDALTHVFERQHQHGQPLIIDISRGGRDIQIELTPGASPDLARLLGQFVLVAAYLGLALLTMRHRDLDLRARLLMGLVTLIALELALPAGFTAGDLANLAIALFWMLITGAQVAVGLHLVSLIPERLPVLRRHALIVPGFYAIGAMVGAGLVAFLLRQWWDTGEVYTLELVTVQNAVLVGWAIAIPSVLAWQAWHADAARERNQALLVLGGLLPWVAFMLVATFWSGWEAVDWNWAARIENVVLLSFPAAVFVAIFRFGLFDIEQIVRRGLVYTVVAALALLVVYILLTAALPWFIDTLGEDVGLWLLTGIAVLCGIAFRPLRQGVERLVENGLFPERRALRKRLIEIAGAVSRQQNMEDLLGELAVQTREALALDWAATVAIGSSSRDTQAAFSHGLDSRLQHSLTQLLTNDSPVLAHVARARRPVSLRRLRRRLDAQVRALEHTGAEVLVPFYVERRMVGILCLSNKRSGELFVREELELLDLFSHQVAASFEKLRLFRDATYEELTGLLRREAVLRQLHAECARAARTFGPLSVFMIDIDHFKPINDAHGHLFGDLILQRVSEVMHENVRVVDSLGRYGGEEFLLIAPDTDGEGALKLASKLRQAVYDLDFMAPDGESQVRVTISIGVSTATSVTIDAKVLAEELLAQADAAVYAAKHGGRNRIVSHADLDKAPQRAVLDPAIPKSDRNCP
jgi:diguanylate cyclase (GGDEF)-like protein